MTKVEAASPADAMRHRADQRYRQSFGNRPFQLAAVAAPVIRYRFWLAATLPRINAPATTIAQVTGSPRNNQANSAPNIGTR